MPDAGETRAARIRVRGLVQGVGFRFFVLREAERIGVKGFVRNLPDGSVEAVAAGTGAAVEEFAARLGIGPPTSRVGEVCVEEIPGPPRFERFEVRF